jgi:malonyl-ACP decarboxylase
MRTLYRAVRNKRMAHTLGGASASGQVSIIQGIQAVLSDRWNMCIAMGALRTFRIWNARLLRNLGAMGTDRLRINLKRIAAF